MKAIASRVFDLLMLVMLGVVILLSLYISFQDLSAGSKYNGILNTFIASVSILLWLRSYRDFSRTYTTRYNIPSYAELVKNPVVLIGKTLVITYSIEISGDFHPRQHFVTITDLFHDLIGNCFVMKFNPVSSELGLGTVVVSLGIRIDKSGARFWYSEGELDYELDKTKTKIQLMY